MSGSLTSVVLRRRTGLALAVAVVTSLAAQAWAADVSYPSSRSLADIAAWLQRETPLQPGQVVDISPQAITAITGAQPMGATRGFRANIASEAVDPAMLAHDGIASWSIPVEVECDRRVVRLGTMTGYRNRDLVSEPRVVREADAEWVNPTPSAPLGSVIRALCDRDFRRPLSGKVKVAANAPETKPGPPPIIEVRPRKAVEPKAVEPKAAADSTAPPTAAPAPVRTSRPPVSIPIPGVSRSVEAKPVAEAKPAAKIRPPAGGGPVARQIGASPSQPYTQALLARFRKKFGADLGGLKADIATVQADGKTVNRALISGFANNAEANAFCKTLADAGQACFIRR